MTRHPTAVVAEMAARRVLGVRSGLVMTAVFYAIVAGVLSAVWRAAAEANHGTLAGYSAGALTWYLCTSEAVIIANNDRLIADIGQAVTSGAIAVELLRPVSALRQRVATEVGTVLPRLGVCCVTGVAIAGLFGGRPPSGAALALAVPSMILAVTANVVAQHAFASASFWFRETGAAWFLYQKLVFMLGGMLIPLELLPGWLRGLALATPFPSMAYMPARLASGHIEPWLLLVQLGWLAVLAVIATLVFGIGERRLQVVGG